MTLERYNELRGTHFGATESNIRLIEKLNALHVSEEEVKAYRLPEGSRQHELRECCAYYKKARGGKAPASPAPAPVKEARPAAAAPAPAAGSAEALIEALNGVLKAPALDETAIRAIVDAAVNDKLQNVKPDRIEIATARGLHEVKGTTHKCFEEVVTYLSNGEAVYLYGPAGTGKTHLAQQAAEALGLEFHYSGQLSQEYKFTGFTDANGRFQPTPFYKAWTEGGLFFLDEMDRSFPEVLTDLNGALANGIFDFPAPIGIKKMHPDFRCMAAGNTIGRGATGLYTAANVLDASSLDRFTAKIEVTYDKRIEDAINAEAADFVRVLRKAASLAGMDVVLSYRAIKGLAKFVDVFGPDKVIKDVITATLNADDINILKAAPGLQRLKESGNRYAAAFAA